MDTPRSKLSAVPVRIEPAPRAPAAAPTPKFSALPPLSIYVHMPWCVRKCPYCDFNSHEPKTGVPQYEYVDALVQDLEHDLPRVWGRKVSSVFIGGGTPSLFAPEAIDGLLSALRARIPLLPNAEITLEANPGTVEQGRFAEYRAAGVNRLSIGVQSFQDDLLERIGRIHGGREAIRAAEQAHAAGFDNFNLDLMFGLPRQTLVSANADIATALDLEPAHISYYQLTIEPNTWFAKHPPQLPADDTIWVIQQHAQQQMERRGYVQYEVSAYARDARRSRHNLNYWTFGDYLGIGAGAHGKITDAKAQSVRRPWKIKHPATYLDAVASQSHVGGAEEISPADLPLEFMMNALRLNDGFERHLFAERTGLPLDVIHEKLEDAVRRDLLSVRGDRIQPTLHGQHFLNDLLQLFMPL
jgi:oxygen-independent coproporphyrinogen-3 oxidase